MVLSEEGEDQLNKQLLELCAKLNLDPKISTSAWESFITINKNVVLEGDAMHWLGCAVFVASQSVETPTLSSSVVRGSGINLTSLLRHSNLSFVQFFNNITRWTEMAHLQEDFSKKITHLKDTFNVAHNTFKEFYPIFSKVFLPPVAQDMDQRNHRNRKQRPSSCNSSRVFEFIWNLFITLKADNLQYSTELIKSYHLLYACIDLAFKNAFMSERRDLLNPKFEGLPRDWSNPSFEPADAPCIMTFLCKSPSMRTEALHMKLYVVKPLIDSLVRNRVLLMDPDLTGIFGRDVFDQNMRNLTNAYETHLLKKADIDERIFLAEYRRQLLAQQHTYISGVRALPSENSAMESPRIIVPRGSDTPLTGRGFLGPREADISPHSIDRTATQKITRLHNLLNNRPAAPSEDLMELFVSCEVDPLSRIQNIVTIMTEQFIKAYIEFNSHSENEARERAHVGITLFYKLIETILQNEKLICANISALVVKDLFYQCMFTCCLEMILFTYNCPHKFPWILEAMGIQAIDFVKVIELIVRSKEPMAREMVKHLNRIEETVLESLAWKSDGKIWEAITASGQDIPKFDDIALPGHSLCNGTNKNTPNNENSANNNMQIPSAVDCFQSPIIGNVNRQLFPTVQAGQSLLQKTHTHIMIEDKEGNRKLIPMSFMEMERTPKPTPLSENRTEHTSSPRRTGSVSILFRKFYHLAGVRMEHLCSKLGLVDSDLKSRIWTVFEKSVRESDLIKDRHLDQLLMCAIYMICRIQQLPVMFSDIMKFYREQPQCNSKVYRDVLYSRSKTEEDGTVIEEQRNDLISFYNHVYVDVMQKFAVPSRGSTQNNLLLSPFPDIKRHLVSPSVQVVGNVFVRPLGSPSLTSGSTYNYFFSRSPSKDLKDINKLVNKSINGKRLMIDGSMDIPPNKRISNRKIQTLVEERRSQNTE